MIREFRQGAYLLALSLVTFNSYALPFNIKPKADTSLPTQVFSGEAVSAFYTITNNTSSVRSGNYIKYLPPHVKQITVDNNVPDLCGSTFKLHSHGSNGDSCTLELSVTGAVNSNDPDPHHHLFACFPGGITCAGTNSPLNVFLVNSALTAVGAYSSNETSFPGIATSNSQGSTWKQQTLPLPSNIVSAYLTGVTCSGATCVAVGDYSSNTYDLPGVALSTDNGMTWSQQVLTPPPCFNSGYLSGVNCNNNICNAVGAYTNSSPQFGTARSLDNGNSWSQRALPLLSPYVSGELVGISCSGNICVGAGTYTDNSFVRYAAAIYSTDTGNSWTQVALPLLDGIRDEHLNGISCSGTFCIAVGEYDNGSGNQLPGIAVSTNGGSSWTQSTLTLPDSYSDGSLIGISCNANNKCVAVGTYSVPGGSNAPTYPAIAVTTDGGSNWSQQVLTSLPSGFTSGALFGVECTGNTCVASGTYDTANFVDTPAIAVSTDGGNTWSQQVLAFPSGIFNADLYGIS